MDPSHISAALEWLEADGRGGFASGTAAGIRTRRYHALLLAAINPPTHRMVLINGFDAWIETPQGRFALTSQNYAPGIVHADGAGRVEQFTTEPWPIWKHRSEDGTELSQEIFVAREAQTTVLTWRLLNQRDGVKLFVRPFLSGRDYHSLHKENSAFRFEATPNGEKVRWSPYEGLPGIYAMYSHNGRYHHEPLWYRNFLYEEERARGLDHTEDLASPGVFEWDLSAGEASWLLTTADSPALSLKRDMSIAKFQRCLRENESARRAAFRSQLHKAADAYLVTGRNGKTVIAGYPWFTDWGRDTFIAVRGLCLASGRLEDARDILLGWSQHVSEGMLPNRFPDQGEQPEYNSVDASLWFIIAAHELLQAGVGKVGLLSASNRRALQDAIEAILEGYSRGTRYGIRMDADGLLRSGEKGVQLTWMDAKVGEWIVTQRAGKPVEIQALWLNALKIASAFSSGWVEHFQLGLGSFRKKFWNNERRCLFDVTDANHREGENDGSMRPNQVFAIGGLPFQLIEGARALDVVSTVQRELLTPLGLRSLGQGEPGYAPRCEGGVRERDGAYHQGTVWPWLIGPFVEAWLRVHGNTGENRREARHKFLKPLLQHLAEAGLGHISEIADADAPHTPRGCPYQAWSLGELLRLEHTVLAEPRRNTEEEIPVLKQSTRNQSPKSLTIKVRK
jgi:predicted glycogen debranching enzyme